MLRLIFFTRTNFIFLGILILLSINCYSKQYNINMIHAEMEVEIGKPAIIEPGQSLPTFSIYSKIDNRITCEVIFLEEDTIIKSFKEKKLNAGDNLIIDFDKQFDNIGRYRVNFVIELKENENQKKIEYDSFYFTVLRKNQIPQWNSIIVHPEGEGKLRYIPDYRGNHIPDYSTAGYMGGGVKLPSVPTKIALDPKPGDDTKRIQEAIDEVSSLQPDNRGFRGAVLLKKGIYEISGFLEISNSGVVLRGEGRGDFESLWLDPSYEYDLNEFKNFLKPVNATVLIATGEERRRLIRVRGESGPEIVDQSSSEIIDQYVPVGANSFRVEKPELFDVGDDIIIQRRGNTDWISEIGMDEITRPDDEDSPTYQWDPFDLEFETSITAIDGNIITVEGSVLNAIESIWGGGRIYKYNDEGRIKQAGIENLRAISFWELDQYGSDGTNHADGAIRVVNVKNSWVKNVVMEHFFNNSISLSRTSSQITIKNSSSLIADDKYYSGEGYRGRTNIETDVYVSRYGFHIGGQSVLVMNCFGLNYRRTFYVDSWVSGPNVFLDCKAEQSISNSEPHHRWSVGGLYDNVSDDIEFRNRLTHGTGHGWAGANYTAWNTRGRLVNEQPPTAQNWAIGNKGEVTTGSFFKYHGRKGYKENTGIYIRPRSLYIHQLIDRKGENVLDSIDFKPIKPRKPEFKNNDNDDSKVHNYPNPANFFTVFSFSLETSSNVILTVYSIEGRQLRKVDYGKKEEGYHEIFWPTNDNIGNPLPNGAYIYRFKINGEQFSNKLVISR